MGGNTSESVDLYVFCMSCMISMLICVFLCDYDVGSSHKLLKIEIYFMLNDTSINFIITYKVFQEKLLSGLITSPLG